ncbi:unnamed protein product [Ostreobium quekettii]|uniref:Protein kinase domain-containing protein n=1 Tax=Ostreobium quekettii TaxID=121088 RepID=A0A8S1J5C8_9CHLO|nr:unnamed protein product [Ostreobium quekettii]
MLVLAKKKELEEKEKARAKGKSPSKRPASSSESEEEEGLHVSKRAKSSHDASGSGPSSDNGVSGDGRALPPPKKFNPYTHHSGSESEDELQGSEEAAPRKPHKSRWESDDEEEPSSKPEVEDAPMPEAHEENDGSSGTDDDMSSGNRIPDMCQTSRGVDEYQYLHKISEGTYGIVYKGREKSTNRFVALKRIKQDKAKDGFPLTSLREINILTCLKHPNIVNVSEVVVSGSGGASSVFMVMEYLDHDLKRVSEMQRHRFTISQVKCIMQQLLSGLAYLHENWVIHRDLKFSNILYNNKGEVKICDFGLARQYGSPLQKYTQVVVTLWYRAPELLLGVDKYSTAIDMWSMGCVMGELLKGKPLFDGKSELGQLDKIIKIMGSPSEENWPGHKQLPNYPKVALGKEPCRLREMFPITSFTGGPTLTDKGFDLLSKLLAYDPEQRISAHDALNHPWFEERPLPASKEMLPTFG